MISASVPRAAPSATSPLMLLVVVAVVALVLAPSPVAAQGCDDDAYCHSRGTAYTDGTGQCQCRCNLPYNGFRCLYAYGANATVDCRDAWYQDTTRCAAAGTACFWNASSQACQARRSATSAVTEVGAAEIPWCNDAFPLPLIMIVYACATVAFGFGGVAVVYLGWYSDVFSRVEDSGERVFNQFYNGAAKVILYAALVVIVSGILAITSWINLNDPNDCTYVAFVWIYLVVQILPFILYPLYHLILWIIRKCASAGDIAFVMDKHVAPSTRVALENPYTNQVRCF